MYHSHQFISVLLLTVPVFVQSDGALAANEKTSVDKSIAILRQAKHDDTIPDDAIVDAIVSLGRSGSGRGIPVLIAHINFRVHIDPPPTGSVSPFRFYPAMKGLIDIFGMSEKFKARFLEAFKGKVAEADPPISPEAHRRLSRDAILDALSQDEVVLALVDALAEDVLGGVGGDSRAIRVLLAIASHTALQPQFAVHTVVKRRASHFIETIAGLVEQSRSADFDTERKRLAEIKKLRQKVARLEDWLTREGVLRGHNTPTE